MTAKRARPKKLRVPEWYVSSFMMDRALDALVRLIVKLDRRHDIPYLAGYSRNGKTIYIDRHMPKWFTFRGRRINTDRFLILQRVPRDLDLKPYKDEHDDGLLRRIAASLEQGRMPLGFRAYRVHDRRKRG